MKFKKILYGTIEMQTSLWNQRR